MDDKKIIKLNLNKIKNIVKLSKNNNIKIFEKKKDKIKLRSMKSINNDIKKIKKKKVKESMNQFQGGKMKYQEIKIINEKLLKEIKEIDSLHDEVSSIDYESISLNIMDKYVDFELSSSDSETFIEVFQN